MPSLCRSHDSPPNVNAMNTGTPVTPPQSSSVWITDVSLVKCSVLPRKSLQNKLPICADCKRKGHKQGSKKCSYQLRLAQQLFEEASTASPSPITVSTQVSPATVSTTSTSSTAANPLVASPSFPPKNDTTFMCTCIPDANVCSCVGGCLCHWKRDTQPIGIVGNGPVGMVLPLTVPSITTQPLQQPQLPLSSQLTMPLPLPLPPSQAQPQLTSEPLVCTVPPPQFAGRKRHFPAKFEGRGPDNRKIRRSCKNCYSNHCKRSKTRVYCIACCVPLCIECFPEWHMGIEDVF
ncbi:hypothetical protein Pelo_3555 [Pelomyxa schiedti]|nr:hypothetical protein Pelo_3555 [Pelomyxa schiedti]